MGIGNLNNPGFGGIPIGYSPFSAVPKASQFFAQAAPAALSPFVATVATLIITPAQIRAASSAPIAFVAGVVGFKHLPISLAYSRNQTPNVNYVTAQTWNIYYANALTQALLAGGIQPNLTNVTGAAISTGHGVHVGIGPLTTAVGGQALMLKASVDATLGGPDLLWSLVYLTVPVAAGT